MKNIEENKNKQMFAGGGFSKLLNKDIKELNKVVLTFCCTLFLVCVGVISYKTNNSYALFSDSVTGTKTIEVSFCDTKSKINSSNSEANAPVLDDNMIPVYYDECDEVWRKADVTNKSNGYRWYNYNEKIWANSVTYNHTEVLDLSNSNNDGNITGGKYTQEGVSFDGDDYIKVGEENYNFGNKITLAVRFKVSTLDEAKHIISNVENGGASIYVNDSNKIMFQLYSSIDSAYKYLNSNVVVEKDKWYTVVGTYDGSNMKIYVNGEIKNTLSLSTTIGTSPLAYYLGVNPGKTSHAAYFKGVISDALVMNDVLIQEDIASNYNNNFSHKESKNVLFNYNLRGYEYRANGSVIPMDIITTMQVWIPRYKYKVWNYNADGTATSSPQEIEITWEDGTSKTGEITCQDAISGTDGSASETCKLKSTNATCTDSTCNNKTYTHPAFTFGDEELTGFWMGKFELSVPKNDVCYTNANPSNCNKTGITPLVKPDVVSYTYPQVGTFETNVMAMNDSNNIYGFNTNTDTHMIKNSEWGAVAYLSHSKYGTCTDGTCREVYINNSEGLYTGRSGGNVGGSTSINETYTDQTITTQYNTYGFYTYDGYLLNYNTNTKSTTKDISKVASTTGNIYGVYDMSGGASEYTMANIISPNGTTMMSGRLASSNSGYTGIVYNDGSFASFTGNYTYPDIKYYDKYSFGTSDISIKRSKLGDAIKEVYQKYDNANYGWYNDNSHLAYSFSPWCYRGCTYSCGTMTGLFYSVSGNGNSYYYNSSRLVVVS